MSVLPVPEAANVRGGEEALAGLLPEQHELFTDYMNGPSLVEQRSLSAIRPQSINPALRRTADNLREEMVLVSDGELRQIFQEQGFHPAHGRHRLNVLRKAGLYFPDTDAGIINAKAHVQTKPIYVYPARSVPALSGLLGADIKIDLNQGIQGGFFTPNLPPVSRRDLARINRQARLDVHGLLRRMYPEILQGIIGQGMAARCIELACKRYQTDYS